METPLEQRVMQVLTEARVVLPGAQALLGFQLAIFLMGSFEALPGSSKAIHLASLACVGAATVFLMAPAAYHRIVERGEPTERLHTFASRMVLLAMAALAPGIAGDALVVVRKTTGSLGWAEVAAAAALLLFYGLWFALTFAIRVRRNAGQRERSGGREATAAAR